MAALTLDAIGALAPDAASLKAAASQMKPAKWPLRAQSASQEAEALVWGECQGSGANPYRVVFDAADLGYKCTCPSRKFPCKHVLALMSLFAEDATTFAPAEPPEWVREWLGRRRRTGGAEAAAEKAAAGEGGGAPARPQSGGDLRAALAAERAAPAPTDPEQAAKDAERAAAAAAKRALATQRAIRGALGELELWLADQLRAGLAATMGELTERCRAIAARLVDGKATSLAGRVDEIPARILALPTEERAEALVREFGKLALLIRAWRASPDTPELRRAVGSAESRDALLSDGAAPLVRARWEVLGEQINTRRDGLVAQSTWLLNLSESADQPENAPPLFAQLLDFYPAHLGRRGGAFAPGDRFEATLAFYPAAQPLRAVIAERSAADSGVDESEGEGEGEGLGEGDGRQWPAAPMGDPLAGYAALQLAAPWTLSGPILLPAGGFARAADHSAWWLAEGEAGHALPLEAAPRPALFGLRYSAMAAIWTGARLQPLAAISDWGRVSLQDGAS